MSAGALVVRALIAATLITAGVACTESANLMPACSRPDSDVMILEAQSVPGATILPCIDDLPVGWSFAGSQSRSGQTMIWLDHDRAGIHAIEVVLEPTCDLGSAVEVSAASGLPGIRTYQEPASPDPASAGVRFERFEGGCIQTRYSLGPDAEPALLVEADQAVSTLPRDDLATSVRDRDDLTLCGAGAPPCAG